MIGSDLFATKPHAPLAELRRPRTLDEVVEARKDVTGVLHPLTDDRRILPIDRTGEELEAHPDFLLVASYNPGYQNILKTLKPSTRQRFVSLEFTFPKPEHEIPVVARESGLAEDRVQPLVRLANKLRAMKGQDLEEGVSTRLVVYCAQLIQGGMPIDRAIRAAIEIAHGVKREPERGADISEFLHRRDQRKYAHLLRHEKIGPQHRRDELDERAQHLRGQIQ